MVALVGHATPAEGWSQFRKEGYHSRILEFNAIARTHRSLYEG